MLLSILTLAAVVLLLYVAFSLTLVPLLRAARKKRRLLREGTEAEAVLLNMERTGVYVNRQPQLKLQVQVHPLTGRNFVSETREVIHIRDLRRLRVGVKLKVKYNPANTKEVAVLRN